MAADRLAVLARLRRAEVAAARRRLAMQLVQEEAAAARLAAASTALHVESAAGEAEWRRWLARGLAERDRAALARDMAADRLQGARDHLGTCRAAERAVQALREQRAAETRREARRREQAMLDDGAGRSRPSG